MGAMIFCLGCGYEHDNLWSCERARVLRERGEVAGPAIMTVAAEIVAKKPKKAKRPGVPQELVDQAAKLGLRLVPKRLEKQREHSKNWRKKRRTKG